MTKRLPANHPGAGDNTGFAERPTVTGATLDADENKADAAIDAAASPDVPEPEIIAEAPDQVPREIAPQTEPRPEVDPDAARTAPSKPGETPEPADEVSPAPVPGSGHSHEPGGPTETIEGSPDIADMASKDAHPGIADAKPQKSGGQPAAMAATATVTSTAGQPSAPELEVTSDGYAKADPELEAALGDMFATPPETVDRRAPTAGPVKQPPVRGSVLKKPRRRAPAPKPAKKAVQPPPEWSGGLGSAQTARSGEPAGGPDFATSNEIASDPALDRSHIDTWIEPPFATDFTDTFSPSVVGERRGQHVHADMNRRRIALNIGWFSLAAVVGSAIGITWLARDSVVRAIPGAAEFYAATGTPVNVRGLDFRDISYSWATDDGRPAIDVKGKIRNVSDGALEIPTVVFVLLDDRGDELYNWAHRVRDEPLAAGAEAAFQARVPAPPATARRLRVRFARKSR